MQPVYLAHRDGACGQHVLGADDDLFRVDVQFDHIKRVFQSADSKAAALSDRVVDHTIMCAQNLPVDMHDFARLRSTGA